MDDSDPNPSHISHNVVVVLSEFLNLRRYNSTPGRMSIRPQTPAHHPSMQPLLSPSTTPRYVHVPSPQHKLDIDGDSHAVVHSMPQIYLAFAHSETFILVSVIRQWYVFV